MSSAAQRSEWFREQLAAPRQVEAEPLPAWRQARKSDPKWVAQLRLRGTIREWGTHEDPGAALFLTTCLAITIPAEYNARIYSTDLPGFDYEITGRGATRFCRMLVALYGFEMESQFESPEMEARWQTDVYEMREQVTEAA